MNDIALNDRERWPDFCKGFAIIIVVIGHAIGYVSLSGGDTGSIELSILFSIDKWIYSFHMALFFFVSGYLQRLTEKKEYNWENIKKRLLSILGPYIVFSIVFWLFKKVFAGSISNPVSLRDLLFIGIFPLSDLWFLYALAVFFILRVAVVYLKINENVIFFAAILLSLISMSLEWSGLIGNTAIPRICKYLSFYFGGAVFQEIVKRATVNKKHLLLSIVLLLAGIVGLCLKNHCTGFCKAIIEFTVAVCNIIAIVIVGILLKSKILQFFGMKSLYVFLVHDYAVCAVVIVARRFLNSPSVMTALATGGGLLFSLFVIWVCTRIKVFDFFFKPQLLLRQR